MTNWKATTGYTLATMRRMACRYEIPGRSKMDGRALHAAIVNAMRDELERGVKNAENLREGALFRNNCGCTMIAMSDVQRNDFIDKFVRALWVQPCETCSEGGRRSAEDLNREQDKLPKGYTFPVFGMSEVLDTTDKVAKILDKAADIMESDGTTPSQAIVYVVRAMVPDVFWAGTYTGMALRAFSNSMCNITENHLIARQAAEDTRRAAVEA